MLSAPLQVIDVSQHRQMDYQRDETGTILIMLPKVSSLRSSLTLLLPTGETMQLPIANEAAERILDACPPA